ncbi:hypothetical protein PN466_06230 [Roseofilum reptotaenium CS-1145]|nr:hypothetical protein [Roseofilum reptotaenium CS-1145]
MGIPQVFKAIPEAIANGLNQLPQGADSGFDLNFYILSDSSDPSLILIQVIDILDRLLQ